MASTYVGIDISKARLDVHLWPADAAFSVARTGSGLAELTDRLGQLEVALVVMEATGGYENVVATAIDAADVPVVVVNPAQIRHFARALGFLAKTDAIDAKVIARFGEAAKPSPRPFADEATQLLADLIARRRQILAMAVAERQRLDRGGNARIVQSIKRMVKALEKELADVDAELEIAVRGSLSGLLQRSCSCRCQEWVQARRGHCSQNCPSWVRSTAARSQHWSDWRRSSDSLASGVARA